MSDQERACLGCNGWGWQIIYQISPTQHVYAVCKQCQGTGVNEPVAYES